MLHFFLLLSNYIKIKCLIAVYFYFLNKQGLIVSHVDFLTVELLMKDNRNSVAFGIYNVVLNILFNGNANHEYLNMLMQNILLSFKGLHMLCVETCMIITLRV